MVRSRTSASLLIGAALLCGCPEGGDGDSSGASATSTSAGASASAASAEATTASASAGETEGSGSGTSGGGTSQSSGDATSTGEGASTGDTATTGEPVDPRLEALITYAPRVWLDKDEKYFPSSVEFAFDHMTRFADGEGKHWIRSTDALASPSDTLPFFGGDLEDAPVYAYYADKGGGVVDLVYFFWYPYNRGKEVVDTIWGNHVGDWEHITVRLMKGPGDALTPVQAYLSAHSFGGVYEWAELERFEATHPVVYSAWGSHGVWSTPGDHVYMSIGETDPVFEVCVTLVCADLTDVTSAGIAWDTWERVAGFDYFAQEGLGDQVWPAWMSDVFTDPGADPTDVPGGGPIFRWGNEEDCSTLGIDISDLIGVCRLEDGPTGPISKDVWGPELK